MELDNELVNELPESNLTLEGMISPKMLRELTGGKQFVEQLAIERAKIQQTNIYRLLVARKGAINFEDEADRAILLTLAVGELYLYNGDKDRATLWLEKATNRILPLYGDWRTVAEAKVKASSGWFRVSGN